MVNEIKRSRLDYGYLSTSHDNSRSYGIWSNGVKIFIQNVQNGLLEKMMRL